MTNKHSALQHSSSQQTLTLITGTGCMHPHPEQPTTSIPEMLAETTQDSIE